MTAMTIEATARGEALFRELQWVHGMVRRDLATVERLAQDVADGLPAADVRAALDELQTNGPLWQLKVNCLAYCRFVHSHHRAEDVMLFPALRARNPAVGPVIDRLEADHRRVSDQLDAVEAAANGLAEDDSRPAREALAGALQALAEQLLEHLGYEERNVETTVLRLREYSATAGAGDGAA